MALSGVARCADGSGVRDYGGSWALVRQMWKKNQVRGWTYTPLLGGELLSIFRAGPGNIAAVSRCSCRHCSCLKPHPPVIALLQAFCLRQPQSHCEATPGCGCCLMPLRLPTATVPICTFGLLQPALLKAAALRLWQHCVWTAARSISFRLSNHCSCCWRRKASSAWGRWRWPTALPPGPLSGSALMLEAQRSKAARAL